MTSSYTKISGYKSAHLSDRYPETNSIQKFQQWRAYTEISGDDTAETPSVYGGNVWTLALSTQKKIVDSCGWSLKCSLENVYTNQ